MDNYDKLMGLLEEEMQAFEDSYKSMSKTQIYNDWYIIGFYTEYYEMLTSGFVNDKEFSDEELNWLASKEKPLRYLYDKWMSCDGSFSHNWDDMLDWMCSVYREEKGQELDGLDIDENNKCSLAEQINSANSLAQDSGFYEQTGVKGSPEISK